MKISIIKPNTIEDKIILDGIIDDFKQKIIDNNLSEYVKYKSDSKDKCKNGIECIFIKDSSDNNSGALYCKNCLTVKY